MKDRGLSSHQMLRQRCARFRCGGRSCISLCFVCLQSSDDEEEGDVCFPALEAAILAAIDEYGPVFTRLNWTAPQVACCLSCRGDSPCDLCSGTQDASWAMGTLKCCSPGDVYLVLKSSDLIQVDLCHPYEECVDVDTASSSALQLVLRRWCNLHVAQEFRCFVFNNRLVGMGISACCPLCRLEGVLYDAPACQPCANGTVQRDTSTWTKPCLPSYG
jgi:hypothetical protein